MPLEVPKSVPIEEARELPREQYAEERDNLFVEYDCGHIEATWVWRDVDRRCLQLKKLWKRPCPNCTKAGLKK